MLRRCVAKRLASSRPVFFPSCFRLRDGESRSALPRRGTKSHLMLRSSRQVLLVVDEERQRRFLTNGSEVDSPGVSKVAFEAERKSEKHVPGRMKFRPHPEGGLGRTRTVVCLIVSEYQFRFFPSLSHQYICRLHRNCS